MRYRLTGIDDPRWVFHSGWPSYGSPAGVVMVRTDVYASTEESVEMGLRADRDPRTKALPLTIRSGDNVEWCRGAAVVAIQTFVLGHRSGQS